MILKHVMQMRLAAGLAVGLAVADVSPMPFAQQTPRQVTTVAPAPTAPLTKSQMKEQRKQQKAQEKSANEAAKAQKDSANALKHQNKALTEQEKAAQHTTAPVETSPATTTPPPTTPPQG